MHPTALSLLLCLSTLPAQELTYEVVRDEATLPILTPSLKERKTAKIRLPNGLEAYLISDPNARKSAGALVVEAGSWDDPDAYPGMAHFLEHMLFMGTKTYPVEAEYEQYIRDHGGGLNAYTAHDHTNYAFSVRHDGFVGAIDQFSHLFIDPLFSPSAVGRELNAVDHEHASHLESDGWHLNRVLKATGNPRHPGTRFSTGTAETLSKIPLSELRSWYETHYHAGHMHLVLLSNLPIDEMVRLTSDRFSQIPPSSRAPRVPLQEELFAQEGQMIYMKPIRDLKSVALLWKVPTTANDELDRKTLSLISTALGGEHDLSLTKELKRQSLIENLSTSIDRHSSNDLLLIIDIDLTTQGLNNVNTVIDRCFQGIRRLREEGIPKYLFTERQKMSTLAYQYASGEDPFSYVMDLAGSMIDEPLASFPEKTEIASLYDPQAIRTNIASLTPERCIFVVTADARLTGIPFQHREPWLGAEYTLLPVSEERLSHLQTVPLHPQIQLPQPNPFIPTAVTTPKENAPRNLPIPELLSQDERGKLYFAEDHYYLVPKASAILSLKTPVIDGSARRAVLTDLYILALEEQMASLLSQGGEAGFSGSLFRHDDLSLGISMHGYTDKSPLFWTTVLQELRKVRPTLAQFDIYKERLKTLYENTKKELALNQSIALLWTTILQDRHTATTKAQEISTLSYEELLTFADTLWTATFIEGLIYGNLSAETAQTSWSQLLSTLDSTPYPEERHARAKVLSLTQSGGPHLISRTTDRQGSSALLVIEYGRYTPELRSAQLVLSSALTHDFFDTLRTKQQTGYLVRTFALEVERSLFHVLGLQSKSHEPTELLSRFDLFLEDFTHRLEETVSQERFATLKESVLLELKAPPENLPSMARRLHSLAFKYDADFSLLSKEQEALEALTYDRFLELTRSFVSRKNPSRVAILMEGVGAEESRLRYSPIAAEELSSRGRFISAKE